MDLIVTITEFDAKGHGIAHTDRGAVLVPFAVPGDTFHVTLRGKRKGVWRGESNTRTVDSPARVTPRCPYVGTCGGCPWQMIDYAQQLRYKYALVAHALANVAVPDIAPVLPCPDPFYFRNRMDYAVGANGELGLKVTDQWWNVLDLSTCFLLSSEAVELMARTRVWMRAHHVVPWDNRTHRGFLRYLVIREGKRTGERMAFLITAPGELPGRDDLLARYDGLATSVIWGVNPAITDISVARDLHVLAGTEELHEELRVAPSPAVPPSERVAWSGSPPPRADRIEYGEGVPRQTLRAPYVLKFAIPPNAFFQTNTAMAEQLVATVRELAELRGTEFVIDLYCGVGMFGIALAGDAARVVGVESEPSAIPVAQRNAVANGRTNIQFHLTAAEAWSFPPEPVDLLIVDPPRSGLHPRMIPKILALAPERIIYVSCNPNALARDLALLLGPYACDVVRPLDVFPHTPHVETVVRLRRK